MSERKHTPYDCATLLAESNHDAASFLLAWVLLGLDDEWIQSALTAWKFVEKNKSGLDHPALMRLLRGVHQVNDD